MKCDIVMVTWNEARITELALKSIRDHSAYPYRLILVDNASDADTVALLERAATSGEFGETVLIRNDQNLGWVKAVNQGLARSDAPYVCLMNNDIVAGPDWLGNIVRALESDPVFGMMNPRGHVNRKKPKLYGPDKLIELDICYGYCLVVKREVIDKIGGLDEIYHPGYYDDNDFSRKAQQAGYRCLQCEDAHVFHHGSVSFNKIPEVRKQLMARNRKIFQERWGTQKRLLALPKRTGNKDFLALAREGHKLYIVQNRFFGPTSLPRPHINIKFFKSPFGRLGEFLLLWSKVHRLRRKYGAGNVQWI